MARRTPTYAIRLAVQGGGQVKAELVSVGQSGEQSLVVTWRPRLLSLYLDGILRASSSAAATNTGIAWSIYRWGFSTSQDFNGDIALIACFASSWIPAMVRRWHADPFGFLRPWNEVPALFGSAPQRLGGSLCQVRGLALGRYPFGGSLLPDRGADADLVTLPSREPAA